MKLSQLFEADETAWLEQMSGLIKERQFSKLDYKNLQEYLFDMAQRDRREVMSRLTVLLTHLLKWDFQPRKRSRSWQATIAEQQHELQDELESKTLRNHALEILPKAYERAVKRAAIETGLAVRRFPPECPYSLDDVLTSERSLSHTANNHE
ncbi:MAG: DUF29 domain-containing protein [Gemmataceae bacterium]|nr:DUF29 domain-containing protein [Gemmataceae bacterium]